jgi:hypothetical protein
MRVGEWADRLAEQDWEEAAEPCGVERGQLRNALSIFWLRDEGVAGVAASHARGRREGYA